MRTKLKQQVLEMKLFLKTVNVLDKVLIRMDGDTWEGIVVAIENHPVALFNFKICFKDAEELTLWVSGTQVLSKLQR